MSSAQKIRASTQKFTEILDIHEDMVLLTTGTACLIIEVQATNFSLLSQEEQQAKIFSYASMLNSLSFPIQILIRNKRVDISSYIKHLDLEIARLNALQHTVSEQQIPQEQAKIFYMQQYRAFVQDLIKVNTVLDKTFYVVISFSSLEKGISGVTFKKDDFSQEAKTALRTKAESVLSQLGRLGLRSKTLDTEQLIKLFHDLYNNEQGIVSAASNPKTIMATKTIQV